MVIICNHSDRSDSPKEALVADESQAESPGMRGCTGDNGEHTNDAEKCSIEAGAYLLKYLAIPPWRGILPQRSNLPVRRRRRNLHWGRKHGVCKTKQTQGKVGHKGPVQTNQSAELSPPNRMPLPALLVGTEFPLQRQNGMRNGRGMSPVHGQCAKKGEFVSAQ